MALYTQGFLHAQERLWQMDKMRRLAGGRLSELVGEKGLPIDKFAVTFGFRRIA
jgi:penicillin amidase